jgi:hypothetical protein
MKKLVFALTGLAIILSANTIQAQGGLGKLKEKMNQPIGGGGAGGSDKKAAEDSTATDLDSRTFTKDKYGISGIYYSQKPIVLVEPREMFNEKRQTYKKFLLQFDEKTLGVDFITRHVSKDAYQKFRYYMGDVDVNKKYADANMFVGMEASSNEAGFRYAYTDMRYLSESGGDAEATEYNLQNFAGNLTMLEPGVLVIHTSVFLTTSVKSCGGPKFDPYYDAQTFNLIYQKGKDISKWTPAKIKEKLFELYLAKCNFNLTGKMASNELPEKIATFKDEPTNADLLAAANARAKQYGYKETITYVYPTAAWTNQYELIGITSANTLTHRLMEIAVVMKSPNGACSVERMTIRQDNIFATGSLNENFKGQKVAAIANGDMKVLDCAKANKYKK